MEDTASKIRLARERKGWSQQQLADNAGVSQTTIDKIERGVTKRSKLLHYVTDALGLKIIELGIEDLDEEKKFEEAERSLVQARSLKDSVYTVPLFASETEMASNNDGKEIDAGIFSVGDTPLDHIPPPVFLNKSKDAYALYVSGFAMSPELSPGDIVFLDPRLPTLPHHTYLFASTNGKARSFGRLAGITSEKWEIYHWAASGGLRLPRQEWSIAHRVVAKFFC